MRILADEGLACRLNLDFYSACDVLWTLKALGKSKISLFGSFELKFVTNVPCYLKFQNVRKHVQKLSENCWR